MEPITIALSTFMAVCLRKAGEKLSEKAIEMAFESRRDIADKFSALFHDEIITLGLLDIYSSTETVKTILEANPEVLTHALEKLNGNPELVEEFNKELIKEIGSVSINARNIGQVVNEMHGTINQSFNF